MVDDVEPHGGIRLRKAGRLIGKVEDAVDRAARRATCRPRTEAIDGRDRRIGADPATAPVARAVAEAGYWNHAATLCWHQAEPECGCREVKSEPWTGGTLSLGMDTSLEERKELAKELGYQATLTTAPRWTSSFIRRW
jgi:hypothetical protein